LYCLCFIVYHIPIQGYINISIPEKRSISQHFLIFVFTNAHFNTFSSPQARVRKPPPFALLHFSSIQRTNTATLQHSNKPSHRITTQKTSGAGSKTSALRRALPHVLRRIDTLIRGLSWGRRMQGAKVLGDLLSALDANVSGEWWWQWQWWWDGIRS
jgi:hypothetical protein